MSNKNAEAISGMHVPSGENLWAYPSADDSELNSEKENDSEEDDMDKKAMGLTSIPGEQSQDFQFEQPFHIKDSDNVGVIDVDTVVDLPPGNNAEDSKSENTMNELLTDLIDELDKRGYKKHAGVISGSIVKRADYEGAGAAIGAGAGLVAGLIPIVNIVPAPIRMLVGGATGAALAHYLTQNPDKKSDLERQKKIVDALADHLRSLGLKDDQIQRVADEKLPPGDIPGEVGGSTFNWSEMTKKGTEYLAAVRLYNKMLKEASEASSSQKARVAPVRRETRPTMSGWGNYISNGPIYKAFADKWQTMTPEGFTPDFSSFVSWYNKKKNELGREFGPEEASDIIASAPEDDENISPLRTEQSPVGSDEANKDEAIGEALPIEPTTDNVRQSIQRLLRGVPMSTSNGDRVFESGRVRRMTRRILRSISGDRTIGNPADQESAIEMAANAVMMGTLDGKSLSDMVSAELKGKSAEEARPYFDGIVWQILQRVSGREGMERRTKRRLDRLQRRSER